MWKLWIILISLSAVVACNSNEKRMESEIFQIRSMGTLSTSEYTVKKIIELNDNNDWYKWGDRKILISCRAKIKAGIALNEIRDNAISVQGKRILIQLPPPKIVSFEMDPETIQTELTEVNGFRAHFSQTDKQAILQQGERAIRNDLSQLQLLDDAEKNAIVFLTDFYKQLGFEEVIIHPAGKDQRSQVAP
jgi:hypothetical protein